MSHASDGSTTAALAIERRPSSPPSSQRYSVRHSAPGMGMGHEVLLALIMAVAMAATVFLYR